MHDDGLDLHQQLQVCLCFRMMLNDRWTIMNNSSSELDSKRPNKHKVCSPLAFSMLADFTQSEGPFLLHHRGATSGAHLKPRRYRGRV